MRLAQGDSDLEVASSSSVASRTTATAGTAIARAVDDLIEKGRRLAADALEAAEADIVFRDGAFAVAGTDRRIALLDLAETAKARKARGDIAEDLDTKATAETPHTYPNGCHVAEVEIDPETGAVAVVAYTAVDDCGRALDPMLVAGQIHGGVAQGLGQALLEHAVYDADSGQLVTGSFMDYGLPRAADLPAIVAAEHNTPATTNPLGVKGVAEAGTTGALAAIMNAIADAIPGPAGRAARHAGHAGKSLGRVPGQRPQNPLRERGRQAGAVRRDERTHVPVNSGLRFAMKARRPST